MKKSELHAELEALKRRVERLEASLYGEGYLPPSRRALLRDDHETDALRLPLDQIPPRDPWRDTSSYYGFCNKPPDGEPT